MDRLAPEDQFRLEILFTQNLKAVRLDEGQMTLHVLTETGEASLPLHPNDRPARYLRCLREVLAGHALGSPGGYPVYLSRWTRQGQIEGENLGRLLLTGEPEAVIAVVHSPSLNNRMAYYAWWIMPTIEHARLMLRNPSVAKDTMGRTLTDFLVEHLPFLQADHLAIMNTVAVLLTAGRLSIEQESALWNRARVQPSYAVAFLELRGEQLPRKKSDTSPLATFAETCLTVLEKPETQDVVIRTLNAMGAFFSAHQSTATNAHHAIIRLAATRENLTAPIFASSSAIGSLMRRKIAPVINPLLEDLHQVTQISA